MGLICRSRWPPDDIAIQGQNLCTPPAPIRPYSPYSALHQGFTLYADTVDVDPELSTGWTGQCVGWLDCTCKAMNNVHGVLIVAFTQEYLSSRVAC